MLFTLIRDWFVQFIWGGWTSTNTYYQAPIGRIYATGGNNIFNADLNSIKALDVGFDNRFLPVTAYMGLGDWLSTISTIIVLIGLVVFFYFIIRYLFRLTSGLIRGR